MVENLMLANSLIIRSFLDPESYSEYCKGNIDIDIINQNINLVNIFNICDFVKLVIIRILRSL